MPQPRAAKQVSHLHGPVRTRLAKHGPAIALAVTLLLTTALRARLLEIPLERDEGEFAYIGQLLLQGVPPYQLAYSLKLPGVPTVYALAMLLFGQTVTSVHLALLVANLASLALVWLLGRRLFDAWTGVCAAAALGVMTVAPSALGTSGHATQFLLPFSLGGFLLLLRSIDTRRSRDTLLSGVLFGLAILMKQHAVFLATFAVLYRAWTSVRESRKLSPRAMTHPAALLAGVAMPIGGVLLVMKAWGVFDQFWFWTVSYARAYVTEIPLRAAGEGLRVGLGMATSAVVWLWLAAGLGLVLTACHRPTRRSALFLAGYLLFGFFAACPGFYFRPHYWIPMLPAVALLASGGAFTARAVLRRNGAVPRALPIVLLALAILWPLVAQRAFLFRLGPASASRYLYGINDFPASEQIGRYIRQHTLPEDRIAVIGSEPQIYFYARRLSATGFIYTYGLMEPQPYAARMQREMEREIELARPKFIVYSTVPLSWLLGPNSDREIFRWAREYLKRGYTPVGVCEISPAGDDTQIWGAAATAYRPASPYTLVVFERTDGTH